MYRASGRLVDGVLDLQRADVVAAGLEHLLQPAHHHDEAVGAALAQVTGLEETVAREGLVRGLLVAVIAQHHARALDLDLPHLAGGQSVSFCGCTADLHAVQLAPDGAGHHLQRHAFG